MKNHNQYRHDKGFTLIELSVVFVVIGILVGSILVTKSMIKTARMQGVIKEVSEIEVNFNLYRETFGYVPGDYPSNKMGSICGSGEIGNGDGVVDLEHLSWVALNIGLGTNYSVCLKTCNNYAQYCTGGTGYYFKSGINVPASEKWPEMIFSINGRDLVDGYVGNIVMAKNAPTTGPAMPGTILTAQEVIAFEAKLDDGLINSGRLIATQGGGMTATGLGCYVVGWKYRQNATSSECKMAPAWRLLPDRAEPPENK